jgi:hypothetical protein
VTLALDAELLYSFAAKERILISKPTVFILGAGASRMYGFPLGAELKNQVLQKLDNEGASLFERYYSMGFEPSEVEDFRDALRESGVDSVDAFLEHRGGEFLKIGKTAIAEALIPFEDESKLFGQDADWYGYLLGKLNAPLDQFHKNRLTILTFNYDRSLEWYMFKALQARYGLKENEVIKLLGNLQVVHLYGVLGSLPWDGGGRAYNPSTQEHQIPLARDKIKIIHEDLAGDLEFNKAKAELAIAERIVFLGFGYNRINVQRLHPEKWRSVEEPILGSAFGLTRLEKIIAARQIGKQSSFGEADWDVLRFLREKVDLEET